MTPHKPRHHAINGSECNHNPWDRAIKRVISAMLNQIHPGAFDILMA